MERPTIEQTLLEIAFTVSKRSTCSRRNNGAVIADSRGVVLSTGYNGSLSGMPHCDHECDCTASLIFYMCDGIATGDQNQPYAECGLTYSHVSHKLEKHDLDCPAHPNNGCQLAVHAEANAVYFAARKGVSVEGQIIYCTTEPCVKCSEAIVQSGIKKVVYRQSYRDHSGLDLLIKAGVEVEQN